VTSMKAIQAPVVLCALCLNVASSSGLSISIAPSLFSNVYFQLMTQSYSHKAGANSLRCSRRV